MKNKKGFTLIELLAVIVLLGLIIMIVVPRVNTSITKARENAAVDSAMAYIKSARDYYTTNIIDPDLAFKSGKNYVKNIDEYVDVKGDRPTSGYITISDNKIIYAKLCINDYQVVYSKSNATVVGACTDIDIGESESFVENAAKVYFIRDENLESIGESEGSILNSFIATGYSIYYDIDGNILDIYLMYYNDTLEEEEVSKLSSDLYNYYTLDKLTGISDLLVKDQYYITSNYSYYEVYSLASNSTLVDSLATELLLQRLLQIESSIYILETLEF